jgi:6-phosphofructokinase 1
MLTRNDVAIKNLGLCRIASPLSPYMNEEARDKLFAKDNEGVLIDDTVDRDHPCARPESEVATFELAGPREKIYFDPSKTRCGIVTCGGLCPGINEVIRSLVRELWFIYGVRRIYGFRYGYQGFIAKYGHPVLDLDVDVVDGIQEVGGTILGSSRGAQDPVEIVDCIERMNLNILFVIGGDGTLRGAQAVAAEIDRRRDRIAVVGIPKTIDNDIMYVDESFGFQTAYSEAVKALLSAHAESKGGPNGVGLVKLMGRHSGFIACSAALAMNDVNFVLIPEIPFKLEGEHGFLPCLKQRLANRGHAVIVVAEGAGQEYLAGAEARDASGNVVLKDIGVFLRDRITTYLRSIGMDPTVKYIDPSYTIRSVPASPQDNIYCMRLAHNAVHAAMAGKTEMVVGRWHGQFVHVPMALCTSGRKTVSIYDDLWLSVLEATGQPPIFR